MIRNYFKTAWRNLWKNKFYSTINIAGLAIGLAVGIMILIWCRMNIAMTAFIKTQATFIKSIHILVRAAMNLYGKAHPAPSPYFANSLYRK